MPNLLDEVNLYYLGGLKDSDQPFVTSKGRAFALPPVGGYLKLPYFNASDLMRRNQIVNKNGSFSVFSLDPRAAERALRGPEVVEVPKEYTREELLAMLAQFSDVSETEAVLDDPAEPVVGDVATPISEEEAADLPPAETKSTKSNKSNKSEKQEAK